ncbi:hypothetical protein ACQPZF_14655 [Actinosynnema sp. CS-041913]|uniref:sunset domain-containing protein n=1 Tax=Actinosynnema sp. CS-041913 TaxID=3239917 RepID=UPI003D9218BF
MFWLFAQMFVLCTLAFLAGAVLTWLPLRATIRDLRTDLTRPILRPALPATAVIIPAQPEDQALGNQQPADVQPADVQPADVQPAELQPADVRPADVQDAELRRTYEHRRPDLSAAAQSAVEVKGSSKSMIFHTPDSPYFKRMKGDVTFRSVAEAERAGYTQWRPKSAAAAAR